MTCTAHKPGSAGRHRRPPSRRRLRWTVVLGLLVPIALGATLWVPGRSVPPDVVPGTTPGPPPASGAARPSAERAALDPVSFPRGTCEVLRVGPGRRAIVALDAGHGRGDPGAGGETPSGRAVLEKDVTRSVVEAAAARLQQDGFTTVLTRSGDDAADRRGALSVAELRNELTLRARCANAARAVALVSVHANSFADGSVEGAETVYEQHRPLAPASRRLAQLLQANVLRDLAGLGRAPIDRGLVDDSAGGESRGGHLVLLGPAVPGSIDVPTLMPSALIEPAFITNPGDASTVTSPRGVDALAAAVARAIVEFVGGARPS